MTIPLYASHQHQTTIEPYIEACKKFAKDVSTKSKYNNYLDLLNVIVEYHNNYRTNGNYYDWLMIIPINLSVATNGFFAGLETKRNASIVRAYKVVLEQMVHDTVDKINLLEPENE
jgi:hypothetical protein